MIHETEIDGVPVEVEYRKIFGCSPIFDKICGYRGGPPITEWEPDELEIIKVTNQETGENIELDNGEEERIKDQLNPEIDFE